MNTQAIEKEQVNKPMPFKSKAQMRWGNSVSGTKALGGKKNVAEWNKESKGKEMPEKKKKSLGQRLVR